MAVQNPERYASAENLTPIFQKIETKLQNRYTKAQADSAIANAIAGVTQFDYEIPEDGVLPKKGKKGVIYLVPNSGTGLNLYNEYIWIVVEEAVGPVGHFELFGSREIDISGKLEKSDVKVESATLVKTDDATGNGFTLGVNLDPIGGLTKYDTTGQLDSIKINADGRTVSVDPTTGQLIANIDNDTIVYDQTTGKVKVSDDFQVDVEPLTETQVNTLKAIFTDDASASGNGD